MQRKVKRGAGITKQPLPKPCHPEAGEGTWKNKPQSVGEGLGVISLHGSMNPSPTARAQVQWEGLPGAGTYSFSCPLLGSSAGNHAKKLSPMDPITWSIPLPCVPRGNEAALGGGCTELIGALNYIAHRCPSAAEM